MNQLVSESCVPSWDPKQCLQMKNVKGSCPLETNLTHDDDPARSKRVANLIIINE